LAFYSQLVIGWLSTTAYNDLALIFFQNLGILAFLEWWETRKDIWLIEGGIFFGLASSVKLIGLYAPISLILILAIEKIDFKKIFILGIGVLMPLLPWFCYSFLSTGNPVYPYFTDWFFKSQSLGLTLNQWLLTRHPPSLLGALWQTVFTRADILSPLIIISLPLVIVGLVKRRRKLKKIIQILITYLIFYVLFWFFTPLAYNRFLLPVLPIYFLIFFIVLDKFRQKAVLKRIIVITIILISIVNMACRFVANQKFIPLLLGKEKEVDFMKRELNFGAGNFYDTAEILKSMVGDRKVLVAGIHNLFYIDVPFKEISWAQKGEVFDFILVGKDADELFDKLPIVYRYPESGVTLYKAKISL
jgi:hypothetical protein